MNDSDLQNPPLEIELIGAEAADLGSLSPAQLSAAAQATLDRLGVTSGHVAIEIVDEQRILELNFEHRDKDKATDVLSFPVDGTGIARGEVLEDGPIELGDVVICPSHTENLIEATVHGVLHLCGYDHEVDEGEMLKLQDEIFASLGGEV